MSTHKERLRQIRVIREQQTREYQAMHDWLRTAASDEDLDALATIARYRKQRVLKNPDLTIEAKQELATELLRATERVKDAEQRFYTWLMAQDD